MIEFTDELIRRLNDLKRQTFFDLLELAGRVFIVVDYDESVVIGKRGFLPEEKERGLILVFNSRMKFNWENDAITATLVFGSTPEKCYIPVNAIAAVFSPDLRVQLSVPVVKKTNKEEQINETSKQSDMEDKGKVIDITKLRKKK
ncbi:ClpXP protease specificity-enhancing factor SspB [Thermodesulfovibrio sp. 3907-1M]|uniref:ClpXP protease specificity-enhancing factor SspB n=1 Tax=Thermodesulfovibrio autotrophicus TaxID=3118333 RepID=A0AAU8GUQ4_9BACT